MKTKIIACEVMKDELLSVERDPLVEIDFVSMGLHLYPEKLNRDLQKRLDELKGYDRVILAFGLCGGSTRNLRAACCPILIPRVHDCIPILFGSREAHEKARMEEAGTFYLTRGWFRGEKDILTEHSRVCEKYGENKARSILKRTYDAYKRVLFIRTGCPEEAEALARSKEIAQLLGLEHQISDGSSRYVKKLVQGPWDEEDFIHISKGSSIPEEAFMKGGFAWTGMR